MYAIVNISGKQFKVSEAEKIYVPLLAHEPGSKIEFNDVMLYSDDNGVIVGSPTVASAKVTATVLEHIKDDKVLVFKKKRRKGYRVLNGHRQQYTRITIDGIEK